MSESGDFNNDPLTDFFVREKNVLGQDTDLFSIKSFDNRPISSFESSFPKAEHLESSKVQNNRTMGLTSAINSVSIGFL